jgi:hypothetical protein
MASDVDICNSALNMIGASNISALTEDSKTARICNQRYSFIRDAVFRSHPWNSLIRRVSLSPDSQTPEFDFSYQYQLPTDPYCLRVLSLQDNDTVHTIEGRKLLCNESTVKLKYVARIVDTNEYDQLLIETLAARLAADVSFALVNSTSLMQQMESLYDSKIREARFVDATEGTPDNITNLTDKTYQEGDLFIASRF